MKVEIDDIIRSKRKTLQLSIARDGRLIVRAPARLPLKYILQFVEEKSEWIKRNKAAVLQKNAQRCVRKFMDGEVFYILGRPVTLTISETAPRIALENENLLFPGKYMEDAGSYLEKWYKNQAKINISNRLAVVSAATGIHCESFRITGARRRWGSCSSKNRLNFSWRLIQAEPAIIDYVILHELCHVRVKNHSRDFWDLVARYAPDYRALRKWLRDHQFLMEW